MTDTTRLEGFVSQRSRVITGSDGVYSPVPTDRFGKLGARGWKEDLVLQGYVWSAMAGSGPSGGGDITGATGGGNGTTIDGDQPDFIIGVKSADWCVIPFDLRIDSSTIDIDADGEYGAAGWFVDSSQATAAVQGTNNTALTPVNLLGRNSPQSFPDASLITLAAVQTSDITDPVFSDVLAFERIQAADTGTAASNQTKTVHAHFIPEYPYIVRGPATIYGYWGGTAAVTAMVRATFAVVPWAYFAA